jgi:hypothetical protein
MSTSPGRAGSGGDGWCRTDMGATIETKGQTTLKVVWSRTMAAC